MEVSKPYRFFLREYSHKPAVNEMERIGIRYNYKSIFEDVFHELN
jgi:hypothetical protein